MNDSIKKTFLLVGILLLPLSLLHAQVMTGAFADLDVALDADSADVEMEGLDVDIQGDDVNVTTDDLDVDINDDTVEVKTTSVPATKNTPAQQSVTTVRTSDGGVDVDTDQVRVQTNTNTGVNTNITTSATGKATTVSTQSGAGLSTRVESGAVSVETEDMLVNIDEDARVLFQSENDVKTYATIVEKKNKKIESIETTADAVEVNFLSEGRLFGIFPMTYVSRMKVSDNGSVVVKGPWYSFLMTKKANALVKSAVEAKLSTMTLAVDADEKPFVRAQMIDVVSDSVSVSVESDGVSVDTGDVSVDISGGNVNVDLQ